MHKPCTIDETNPRRETFQEQRVPPEHLDPPDLHPLHGPPLCTGRGSNLQLGDLQPLCEAQARNKVRRISSISNMWLYLISFRYISFSSFPSPSFPFITFPFWFLPSLGSQYFQCLVFFHASHAVCVEWHCNHHHRHTISKDVWTVQCVNSGSGSGSCNSSLRA
jgi:hypothetical protein